VRAVAAHRLGAILVLAAWLPAAPATAAVPPGTTGGPATTTDRPAAAAPTNALEGALPVAGDVKIRVDVAATDVSVGRPFTVTFRIAYPEGTRTYFPDTPAVAPLVLVKSAREASAVLGQGTGETHTLTLLPVRVGAAVVPPIEIPYVTAAGEAKVATTPEVRVQVGSTVADEAAPELAAAGAPVPVRVRNLPLLWSLAGLAVALVTAILSILAYRRIKAWRDARRPPPPPRPAHEVAFERLAEIEAMGLVESGEFGRLALLVSEVVREFLGTIHGFSGVDLTTWEVLRILENKDLRRLSRPELEDFLSLCDLIKFAKHLPSVEEAGGLTRRARDAVERAMPLPGADGASRPVEG